MVTLRAESSINSFREKKVFPKYKHSDWVIAKLDLNVPIK